MRRDWSFAIGRANEVEAEEVYRENMKDVVLVITDMMMPVRDGRETILV